MKSENIEYAIRYKNGDKTAGDQLIEKNSALVWSVVRHFIGRGETDDLFQLGCIGLLKAALRFDTSYDTQFSTYAVHMIIGEIKRHLRDDGAIKISRIVKENLGKVQAAHHKIMAQTGNSPTLSVIASECGLSENDVVYALDAGRPLESLQQITTNDSTMEDFVGDCGFEESVSEKISLKDAIEGLSNREGKIIYLRYYKNLTQVQTGKIMNISQVQVSRIEKAALGKLKRNIG